MAVAPLHRSFVGGKPVVVKVTAGVEVAVWPPLQFPVTVTEYWVLAVRPARAMGEAVPVAVMAGPVGGVAVTV
jgi:hypothetical protein